MERKKKWEKKKWEKKKWKGRRGKDVARVARRRREGEGHDGQLVMAR